LTLTILGTRAGAFQSSLPFFPAFQQNESSPDAQYLDRKAATILPDKF
jgi:hypothetical protein